MTVSPVDAAARLKEHMEKLALGGNHPLMVIVPRDAVAEVVSLLAVREARIEELIGGVCVEERCNAELERLRSRLAVQKAELERLRETIRWLADFDRLALEPPHDPDDWHGGMAENIAACPVCVVRAALAAVPDGPVSE